ncbi:NUDIX hydrolase [Candidatus Roizmanbacteria bacterium]|nr:NUDIX hydrolase [Candidatus Roizmanbacteria bacterium]
MINCSFENDNKNSLRHVVVDMIVVKDNQILLVKRAPQLTNGNKYALIGGFMERNETSKQAALREIMEETGYKAEIISLFRIVDNPDRRGEDRQNISFVYLVKPLEKIGAPDHEVKELKWFDLDKLPKPEEFAFDHLDNINLYLQHLKNPFQLPILGK